MVNVLVVGGGSIGKRHMKNFKSHGCTVEGVEIKDDVRAAIEKELGFTMHANLQAALSSKKFDAALIGVPAKFHVETALECAKHGLHLIVEKPLCLDFIEKHPHESEEQHKQRADREKKNLTELFKIIKEKKLVSMIGYMNRHSEPVKTLKKLIDEKAVGEIVSIHSENCHNAARMHPGHAPSTWFIGHKEMGGDTMLEDSHGINLLSYLFGEIDEVSCMTAKVTNTTVTSNDQAEMLVKFKNGTYGTAHTDLYCELSRAFILVRGVNGIIMWDRQGDNNVKVTRALDGKKTEEKVYEMKEPRDQWFLNEELYFLDCIKNGKQPSSEYDLRSGYETVSAIMAGSLSNKEKRTVKTSEIFKPF